jgi:hypothetical protein
MSAWPGVWPRKTIHHGGQEEKSCGFSGLNLRVLRVLCGDALIIAATAVWLAANLMTLNAAQPPAASPPQTPVSARSAAPVDFTGYWTAEVTEDWRYRMVRPARGDYASVPLNPEGRKVADSWDPARDEAAGAQCKAYGAAAIMRVPGHLHITWENDNTLRIDADAGTQTRRLRFGEPQAVTGEPQWQGSSVARWEGGAPGRGGRGRGGAGGRETGPDPTGAGLGPAAGPAPGAGGGRQTPPMPRGSLRVVTTHMRPGYLRKNGVPYSENAVLTEYFTRVKEPDGDEWLVVTTIVEDSRYLEQPFITSTHFKREPNGAKWSPTACQAG